MEAGKKSRSLSSFWSPAIGQTCSTRCIIQQSQRLQGSTLNTRLQNACSHRTNTLFEVQTTGGVHGFISGELFVCSKPPFYCFSYGQRGLCVNPGSQHTCFWYDELHKPFSPYLLTYQTGNHVEMWACSDCGDLHDVDVYRIDRTASAPSASLVTIFTMPMVPLLPLCSQNDDVKRFHQCIFRVLTLYVLKVASSSMEVRKLGWG